MSSNRVFTASLLALASAVGSAPVAGQSSQGYESLRRETGRTVPPRTRVEEGRAGRSGQSSDTEFSFKNKKDSLNWAKNKALAEKSTGFRVIVSLQQRHMWVITDEDTLLSAPAAVAKGNTLAFGDQKWTFDTPRGKREVLGKDADPIWQPPEWLYAEVAKEHGLKLARIPAKGTITTSNGLKLTVQDNEVKVIDSLGVTNFPTNLHIIFGETLYIPPMGTENRRVNGTLGKYKLSLGEGYLLHGTPDQDSIGLAATHGCVRLRDEDIEWLFDNVPVGTKVYIY